MTLRRCFDGLGRLVVVLLLELNVIIKQDIVSLALLLFITWRFPSCVVSRKQTRKIFCFVTSICKPFHSVIEVFGTSTSVSRISWHKNSKIHLSYKKGERNQRREFGRLFMTGIWDKSDWKRRLSICGLQEASITYQATSFMLSIQKLRYVRSLHHQNSRQGKCRFMSPTQQSTELVPAKLPSTSRHKL